MGHVQHYQTLVLTRAGFGVYRHESEADAWAAVANAFGNGYVATCRPVVKAFPLCPDHMAQAARKEMARQRAELRSNMLYLQPDGTLDDIPW